jgi:hypothetical protein
MKVYILIENTGIHYEENAFAMKENYLRGFSSMQAAINAMRLWKPRSIDDLPCKIIEDEEYYNRHRKVTYTFWLDDTPMVADADLRIRTVELE